MDGLKPLKPLNPDGNLKSWKCGNHGNKILFMAATEYDKKPGNAEISSHIYLIELKYLISDFRLQQFKDETKLGKTLHTYIYIYIDR